MSASHNSFGSEAAPDEVRRRRSSGIRDRRAAPLPAPRDTFQLELAHQAGDTLPADADAMRLPQLGVPARRPLRPTRLDEDPPDQRRELRIIQCPPRQAAPTPRVV